MTYSKPSPSDAELVAYLDGELSPSDSVRIGQQIAGNPAVSDRVTLLMQGARPFREAFAPLLHEAPLDRLEGRLSAVLETRAGASRRRITKAATAAIVLLFAGAGLDRFAEPVGTSLVAAFSPANEGQEWRTAATWALSLYSTDTLAAIPDAHVPSGPELADLGARIGIDLTPARLALADLALKRAELFDYDGAHLAFLAYLDPKSGPVALCIGTADPGEDATSKTERRNGLTTVSWSSAGHDFMLMGRADPARLQALAAKVAERLGHSGGRG